MEYLRNIASRAMAGARIGAIGVVFVICLCAVVVAGTDFIRLRSSSDHASAVIDGAGFEGKACGPQLEFETPSCSVVALRNGYEIRQYPDNLIWVETLIENSSYAKATTVGFFRCFDFISGKNSKNEIIEMTGPVLIKPAPDAAGYKISFFVPSRFKSINDLPTPLDSTLRFVQPEPELHAVVGPFGGFPGVEEYKLVWKQLKRILDSEVNIAYDESTVVYAGYSSPFQILNRAQELHVNVYPHRCL